MANDYTYFKKAIYDMTKIDLNAYKENQMKRRIDTLINKHNIVGYENFVSALKTDNSIFEAFINYLTINVSEFYRNPEQWELLKNDVMPKIIDKFGKNLNIWSAACATGDEPYSLVMMLSELIPINLIRIKATDIDKQVLSKASLGLYNEKSVAGVPSRMMDKYFDKIGHSYKISDNVKGRVSLSEHNLLKDNYPDRQHLIVCRNVLIYFTEEAKALIFKKFYNSLAIGGVLFIGSTEQILDYKELGFERMNSFFYMKK